jgi:hypothetical protein
VGDEGGYWCFASERVGREARMTSIFTRAWQEESGGFVLEGKRREEQGEVRFCNSFLTFFDL